MNCNGYQNSISIAEERLRELKGQEQTPRFEIARLKGEKAEKDSHNQPSNQFGLTGQRPINIVSADSLTLPQ
jgi:hypothetical protein